jgi:lysophospholipid acyltransferase (LPLAT)-like uncharacterized protein
VQQNYSFSMLHLIFQHLVWYLIKILYATLKVQFRNKDEFEAARALNEKRVFIFALWHENVVATLKAHAYKEPWLTLASKSKDGDYAAFVATKLGFTPVRGSSKRKNKDKGGKEAMLHYVRGMQNGMSGGITVDGPRGPRRQCKPGVVAIAHQTGAPIVPVTSVASSYWEFNSWDRFKIPRPFSTITVTYGQPILIPEQATLEEYSSYAEKVTQALNELEK